ncbi:unnamed protein product [Linum trigynum]|uniref:Uncharacterized protein n=1 Tax=Linum trigynum TaxID=586398 RepID=A0AAV2FQ18_9ROSI
MRKWRGGDLATATMVGDGGLQWGEGDDAALVRGGGCDGWREGCDNSESRTMMEGGGGRRRQQQRRSSATTRSSAEEMEEGGKEELWFFLFIWEGE